MPLSAEFDEQALAPHLGGFNIIGCAVRSKDLLYFLARRDYRQADSFCDGQDAPDELDLEKRVLSCFLDEPPAQVFGHTALHDFELPWCALSLVPRPQLVCITLDGLPYAIGSGEAGIENRLDARGAITRLRLVGAQAYAVGTRRTVYRRDGRNQWHAHSPAIPLARHDEALGFHDIAGFGAQDIYAVGGSGDVWHFDGHCWRQCSFPDPVRLGTVCCGADGQVYIGAEGGAVYQGRRDRWQRIADPSLTLSFKDMVWYDGRVWCSSDAGLWWVRDGRLCEAELPPAVRACCGCVASHDDVLLLAGYGGAALLEGQRWRVLFHA